MQIRYELKVRGKLGLDKKDDKKIRILNRCVKYHPDYITYEADPRHAEIMVKELVLDKTSSVITSPGQKEAQSQDGDEFLNAEDSTFYRRLDAEATSSHYTDVMCNFR